MAVRNLQFVLSGSDKSASKSLDRVGTKAEGLGRKLAGVGKAAAFGVGGVAVAAVGGLAAAMVNGIKDAQEYQTLALKTAAAIKSTGNEANTSVKGVQKLAGELESLSGVDEELIINGQNVLLTFTKIRNEVGEGNDIFDRATEAALNMSVALGQDMQGSVTMLGKALNDPIKGITAMGKAGIQFTKQQKDQIKTLVNSGRTLDAQKIILKELEVQFGGVAKAAGSGLTGSIARAKDAFGDLFRNIATPLLPKIAEWAEGFATKVNDDVAPAIMRFIDQFERGVGPGGEFRDNLVSLGESARDAWPHIKEVADKTKTVVDFVIDHKDAFATITAGVVAYKTAMAGAAAASALMGLNGPKAAAGMTAAGTAATLNAGKVGLLATALGRVAGVAGLITAGYMTDEQDGVVRGTLDEIGGGFKKIGQGEIWDGVKDILGVNSDNMSGGISGPPKKIPTPAPRPGGSTLDRAAAGNPVTKTYRDQRTAGSLMAPTPVALVDGRKMTTAVSTERQRAMSRGLIPAF